MVFTNPVAFFRPWTAALSAVALFLATASLVQPALTQELPTGVTIEPFYDVSKPGLSFAKDQLTTMQMYEVPGKPLHFLVLGYYGYVWTLYPNPAEPSTPGTMTDYARTQVADFNEKIMKGWEQGAIAGGFDPDFSENRRFYILYQKYLDPSKYHGGTKPTGSDGPGNNGWIVVERWVMSADHASMKYDTTLFQAEHGNGYGTHNMVFGTDGLLYISMDSYSRNSWDLGDFQRKVLRIDVTRQDPGKLYAIPPTNPFYNSSDPKIKKEIWAYGFRNTWSVAYDYLTGKLWGAEVGQSTWEEVNIIEAGKNYGWANGGDGSGGGVGVEGPCSENTASGKAFVYKEGWMPAYTYSGDKSGGKTFTCADFTDPKWHFSHSGKDQEGIATSLPGTAMAAIILGPAFRGDPSSPFYGYHFISDIRRNYFIAAKEGVSKVQLVGGFPDNMTFSGDRGHNGIVSFSEDSYGNLYAIIASSSSSGSFQWHDIYRIKHTEMKPLSQPRNQVVTTSTSSRLRSRLDAAGYGPMLAPNPLGATLVRLPKGRTGAQVVALDGKLGWSGQGMAEGYLRIPEGAIPGPSWLRFLP